MKNMTLFVMTIWISVFMCSSIYAADLGNIETHGFISQGYLSTSKNNYLSETEEGSFQFNEMGINFKASPTDKLSIGCQFFSRDLGDVGNDDVTINWAFGEFSWREWMGLRAGMIKFPFGFYNDNRDMDMLRTSIFLSSSVYNEWQRDSINSLKGFELYGNIELGAMGTLTYQLQTGETQLSFDSGTVRRIEVLNGIHEVKETDVNTIYNSKLEWMTPLNGLRIGVTYAKFDYTQEWNLVTDSGNSASFDNKKTEFFTYSIEYMWNDLVLAAEIYRSNGETDLVMHLDSTWAPLITETPGASAGDYTVNKDLDSDNKYYVSASYRFTDWFEFGTYYSFYESDPDKEFTSELEEQKNELTDICLSARFDINDNWTLKIEGHKMDGLNGVEPEEDGTFDEDWFLYAAKMTFSF